MNNKMKETYKHDEPNRLRQIELAKLRYRKRIAQRNLEAQPPSSDEVGDKD
jgi:hypothetical protein